MLDPASSWKPSSSPSSDLLFGYSELRPPYLGIDQSTNAGTNQQWRIVDGVIEAVGDFNAGGGWVVGRWGENSIPLGHLDGSVEVVDRYELASDMTRWSPFATGLR
jgi:hypothetical protein